MKKILVTILTVAMMTSAVAAFADGGPKGGPMGGQPPRMEQGQQAPRKPDAAPEKPSGEKPADAPEEPADLSGRRPEIPSGEQGQAPSGEKPADAPEMPSGDKQSGTDDTRQAPEKPTGEKPSDKQDQAPTGGQKPVDGQQPTDGRQAPKMIDFEAMVTGGVITQETRDAIKAYMDEHKPEGEMPSAPAEGEAPAGGEPSLLNDLLNAGIITQTEYDAMNSAA